MNPSFSPRAQILKYQDPVKRHKKNLDSSLPICIARVFKSTKMSLVELNGPSRTSLLLMLPIHCCLPSAACMRDVW